MRLQSTGRPWRPETQHAGEPVVIAPGMRFTLERHPGGGYQGRFDPPTDLAGVEWRTALAKQSRYAQFPPPRNGQWREVGALWRRGRQLVWHWYAPQPWKLMEGDCVAVRHHKDDLFPNAPEFFLQVSLRPLEMRP